MTKETADFLVRVSEYCGNQEARLHEHYSGRCMYNQTTCAVIVDNYGQLLADVLNYFRENVGELNSGSGYWTEEIDQFSIDSMGRGVVIY